jgi:uncharacterized protein DUF6600
MKIASLFLVVPMLGASSAYAQVSAGVTLDANISIGGEPIDNVDVFYDQLSPYGVWVAEPRLGRVFIPDQDGYVPYRVGHWAYTDVGMVWVSAEPFAWATSHYGRWAFSPVYARWVWRPDTDWGPAWVDWRESGDDFGWAPLAPDIAVGYYQPPIDSWHYCPANRIFEVNLINYYEPRERVVVIERSARPIAERRTVGRTQVVVGPPPERLRAHRVEPRVQKVDAKIAGRLPAEERRAADQRARARKAQVEQENQRRVAAKPKIRDVEVKVKKEAPQEARKDEQQRKNEIQQQQERREDNQQRAQQQREENQRKQQQQRAEDQRRDERKDAQQAQEQQRRDEMKQQQQRREDNQQRAQEKRDQAKQQQQSRNEKDTKKKPKKDEKKEQ